jgi:NAD-dependent SIR2 family protein deacetylase
MNDRMELAGIEAARDALHSAESFLFTAGAGMGVDSGLPDFRGDEGFWRAYPPLRALGLSFRAMANPQWFETDPRLAWGFYGHRLNLYRATVPHAGFAVLKRWSGWKPTRVYTSNVDGHFQRVGLDDVCEVHGSIHHLQCTRFCSDRIWSADELQIQVDEATFRAEGELPTCPFCGALARPNILMFWDDSWVPNRSGVQEKALFAWLRSRDLTRLVVVECGAGTAVPTVRGLGELLQHKGATLVRINVREAFGPSGTISLPLGAKAALEELLEELDAEQVG